MMMTNIPKPLAEEDLIPNPDHVTYCILDRDVRLAVEWLINEINADSITSSDKLHAAATKNLVREAFGKVMRK